MSYLSRLWIRAKLALIPGISAWKVPTANAQANFVFMICASYRILLLHACLACLARLACLAIDLLPVA
jgi:hypothetical protein